jgi:adenylate kinase
MKHNNRYIFLGPPGSGKGTQAKIIAGNLSVPHIDMGSTIRAAIKNGTEAGLKAKAYVEAGQLVPADIVIAMALERLKESDTKNGFVLDGYPRSIEQAEALEKFLTEKKMGIKVFNLQVPVEKIIARLGNRLLCSKCSAVYNRLTKPPKVEGKCDECKGDLYVRADDNPETIRNRFRTYEEETAPLIGFYSKQGNLVDVNADGEIDQITGNIVSIVSKRHEIEV